MFKLTFKRKKNVWQLKKVAVKISFRLAIVYFWKFFAPAITQTKSSEIKTDVTILYVFVLTSDVYIESYFVIGFRR